ncbi:carboxylating nicotinate-nucleotide diphosphorylase [Candidatus Bathyarchaeota archaeon]|nr:carboxylating nicotinate-nucleotide diphosphorylase [Candidatus Bathyarchaeota archaeon]
MEKAILRERLMEFLREDLGMGDVTTEAIVPAEAMASAHIIAKEPMVVAGLYEASVIFEAIGVDFRAKVRDGEKVDAGTVLAEVYGRARDILSAERTVLNILMRMSGIATQTKRIVEIVRRAGFNVRIAATRKTAPGLRLLDKRAVAIGGGDPHRFRLDDAVLIKDNHIRVAGGVREAVQRARSAASFSKKIEVEVQSLEEALEAAECGVDILMLDNMSVKEAKRTIEALEDRGLRGKVIIEVSGRVEEENILKYARLGPDVISVGALTHSVRAADISLEVVEISGRRLS